MGNGRPSSWSDSDNQVLREMWTAGASQKAIAEHFGRALGTVSGQITALGLRGVSRPKPAQVVPSVETRAARAIPATPSPASAPRPSPVAEIRPQTAPCEARPSGGKPEIIRRTRECIWVSGERPHYVACSEAAEPGKPFCTEHCKIGFTRTAYVAGVGRISA